MEGLALRKVGGRHRTEDVVTEETLKVSFGDLLLPPEVVVGLEQHMGFGHPSPVQIKAIPLLRFGLDVIVQAKSGTGKTCVFAAVSLETIQLSHVIPQVLVVAPTREIAVQISGVISTVGSAMEGLRVAHFIGGVAVKTDRKVLSRRGGKYKKGGCHIVVGTPGRLKQLIKERILTVNAIRLFILDEADKLCEETFHADVKWLFDALPQRKQVAAFSATYPAVLMRLLHDYMRDAQMVQVAKPVRPATMTGPVLDPPAPPSDNHTDEVAPTSTVALKGISQYYVQVDFGAPVPDTAADGKQRPPSALPVLLQQKTRVLSQLLSQISFRQCMVFLNDKEHIEMVGARLREEGWAVACIWGHLEQSLRLQAIDQLRHYQVRILLTSDLTARGIDIEGVNLVVNLDLPMEEATYFHRIGRAGRFGALGVAVSVVEPSGIPLLQSMQERHNMTIAAITGAGLPGAHAGTDRRSVPGSVPQLDTWTAEDDARGQEHEANSQPKPRNPGGTKADNDAEVAEEEEHRQDPTDRRWYPLADFLLFYDGTEEWDAAPKIDDSSAAAEDSEAAPAAQAPAAHVPPPLAAPAAAPRVEGDHTVPSPDTEGWPPQVTKEGPGAPTAAETEATEEEHRQDPTDGRWYPLADFLLFYDGPEEWDAAPRRDVHMVDDKLMAWERVYQEWLHVADTRLG